MRGFGVKDGERDTFVAWIEAAHTEGQIGEADRDLRVARARGAETRDELVTLTRDLRPATARPVAAGVQQPPMVRVRPTSSRRAGGVLVGLGIFLVLVGVGVAGIVALFALAVGPGERDSVSVPEASAAAVVVTPEGGLDARQLRAFLRACSDRFGTSEVVQLALADGQVVVTVAEPIAEPGATPLVRMWGWSGSWQQLSGRTPAPADLVPVDLASLDVRLLLRNVDVAREALGAQARVVRLVIADSGSGARVRIDLVGNDVAGTLVTTPSGKVVRGVRS